MAVDVLLNRLDKVRQVSPGKWQARCPAHADKSPSLSIADQDGVVLVHCFAQCSVEDICGAVGIDMTELFPPKPLEASWDKPERPAEFGRVRFTALDALRCLHDEAMVIAVCAADLASGRVLDAQDDERLGVATVRIANALEYLDANR